MPTTPRVFLMGSHQPEDPEFIVAILVMENLYTGRKVLDPRGVFVVQGRDGIRVWVGAQVPKDNIAKYRERAEKHVETLQRHEKGAVEWDWVN